MLAQVFWAKTPTLYTLWVRL